jgi:ankyrin repeat protein
VVPVNVNILNSKDGNEILEVNELGSTPLLAALTMNFTDAVLLLLQNKADT